MIINDEKLIENEKKCLKLSKIIINDKNDQK